MRIASHAIGGMHEGCFKKGRYFIKKILVLIVSRLNGRSGINPESTKLSFHKTPQHLMSLFAPDHM